MANKMNQKRVLHIVSTMDRGGAETLIMNVYRNIDRTKVQFDFVTHKTEQGDYDEEILSLGGKVFNIPSLGDQGPINYIRNLITIMSGKRYDAVHAHTDYQAGFPALAAKLCGIKTRICHSHSNNWSKDNRVKTKITFKVLQTLIKFTATSYCSCSKQAAHFLFGKNAVEKSKVNILNNGIELSQYINVDPDSRRSVIDEFQLKEDVKIIGHVGKFSASKNHIFIIKVLKKLVEVDDRFTILLVGDGPLKMQIEMEAERMGVRENIRFVGVRTDIPRLMKAFDVFLFPSIFEGFGIVVLESQSAGTPCVASDSIPKTTDMGLNLITFISLDADLNIWIEEIQKAIQIEKLDNKHIAKKVSTSGFNITENVPNWLSLYG